jgi:metal-responsive CopG/Arc/MetJ family transcriptional regulator
MSMAKIYSGRTAVRLDGDALALMDGILRADETRSDFIRKAVQREIDARMTETQVAMADA